MFLRHRNCLKGIKFLQGLANLHRQSDSGLRELQLGFFFFQSLCYLKCISPLGFSGGNSNHCLLWPVPIILPDGCIHRIKSEKSCKTFQITEFIKIQRKVYVLTLSVELDRATFQPQDSVGKTTLWNSDENTRPVTCLSQTLSEDMLRRSGEEEFYQLPKVSIYKGQRMLFALSIKMLKEAEYKNLLYILLDQGQNTTSSSFCLDFLTIIRL